MRLAYGLAVVVVGVARGERHEDGVGACGTDVGDIMAHIVTVSIDRVYDTRLLDGDDERVVSCAGDGGAGSATVVGAVVVMPNGDNHPVAGM